MENSHPILTKINGEFHFSLTTSDRNHRINSNKSCLKRLVYGMSRNNTRSEGSINRESKAEISSRSSISLARAFISLHGAIVTAYGPEPG